MAGRTIPPQPRYPQTQAERQAVATRVRNINVADIPRAPDNIVELGIFLRNLGIPVTEHSLFGGVDARAHQQGGNGKPRSEHYYDKAFDLNLTPKGVNEADSAWAGPIFDELARKLRAAGWTDILWRTTGHYNHMHIGYPGNNTSRPRATSSPNPQPAAESATDNSATAAEQRANQLEQYGKIAPNSEKNVLNNYRSWNYNIAIAGMPASWTPDDFKDRAKVDNAINDYHIIDSSGKFGKTGVGGVTNGGIGITTSTYKSFLEEYNESSPGRYDFFIDDLVITSAASNGNEQSGPAATFKIEFTVFEPYGMNGFVEALGATALATGWNDIRNLQCVMKIWFVGYPDAVDLPVPTIIPDSTRYYKIIMSEITADVNEEGTRYRIKCISATDLAFGSANHHFAPIEVRGSTVYDQIRYLFSELNRSVQSQRNASSPDSQYASIYDSYEVSFPIINEAQPSENPIRDGMVYSLNQEVSLTPTDKHNNMVRALMPIPGRDASQPATTDPSRGPSYPGSRNLSGQTPQPTDTVTAQVDSFTLTADRQIHQWIADIILRSNYISQDVLQRQLEAAKKSPTNNTITYFKIIAETYTGQFDVLLNRYTRVYRYIVMPYEIHYTEIPGQEQGIANYDPLMKQIKREYNYMFTGKNVDVIKYNITYNNLYTSAALVRMGNDANTRNTQTRDGPANTVDVRQPESQSATTVRSGDPSQATVPAPPIQTVVTSQVPTLLETVQGDDPYSRFAQLVNDTLLQRNSEFIDNKFLRLEMDILGDPFFLTSHNVEYMPPTSPQQSGEGSARINNTDLFININFRAPRDVHKNTAEPSLADFGDRDKLLPYSGIYRVFTIESSFKGGLFTQKLTGSRGQGQIITIAAPTPAADFVTTRSLVPGSQVTEDSADPSVNRHGIREDGIDFSKFFNRGLPTVGLPGAPADFTAAISQTQSAILTKVSGATAQFTNALGPQASDLASQATSGIKISPSALQSVVTDASAAAVGVAGSLMEQVGNIDNAAKNLANDMIKQATSLTDKLEQDVANLEDDFTSAVGDAKNAVQKLQNAITTDPSGIASKLGIDPAKISGLSEELSTKLTQELNKVADLVPPNANLAGLERAGVVFANMVGSKLANLPPLQPGTPAPKPIFDAARVAITDANGNVIPLLNGQANLAALTEINNVKNSLGQVASGYGARFKSAAQTMLDKVGTVQLSVDNITALSLGVANPVGGLGENSLGSPSPASVGLGSKENNSGRVDALVQATSNVKAAQVNLTLASQVGSKSATSPLTTLVNDSNIQGKLV